MRCCVVQPLPNDEEFGKKRRGTNDCLCECGCWCIGVFEQQVLGSGEGWKFCLSGSTADKLQAAKSE